MSLNADGPAKGSATDVAIGIELYKQVTVACY